MRNIFKMDMRRLLHTKSFYVSLIFLVIMAASMVITGMGTNLPMLMGAGVTGGAEDFMNSMMGTGVIFILLGITLTIFICNDYSSGFAKSLFTSHANKKEYIGGRMMSMTVVSAFLLVFYTIVSMIALAISGYGVSLAGGFMGLVGFLVEKWIISCAFLSLVMLLNLVTRNIAVGVTTAFLVATGGLTMGLTLFGEMLGMTWLSGLTRYTISGTAQMSTLSFNTGTFFQILLVNSVWLVGCYLASRKILATKDV